VGTCVVACVHIARNGGHLFTWRGSARGCARLESLRVMLAFVAMGLCAGVSKAPLVLQVTGEGRVIVNLCALCTELWSTGGSVDRSRVSVGVCGCVFVGAVVHVSG
jgi:hypothetical protein